MSAKDYIIKELREISEKINGISLRYAFDSTTNFHIIEVSPEYIRRGSEDYMELESAMWTQFYTLFPCEDILITEESDVNDMSNILYTNNFENKYGNIVNEKFKGEQMDEYGVSLFDCSYHSNVDSYQEYAFAA